jgi:inner membrane protein
MLPELQSKYKADLTTQPQLPQFHNQRAPVAVFRRITARRVPHPSCGCKGGTNKSQVVVALAFAFLSVIPAGNLLLPLPITLHPHLTQLESIHDGISMEPVTHFLTGACIGRAGLNRRTAYATLAATLAAEAPDLDVLWGVAGPVASFAHHRGITHTLIAAPVMAGIVTGFVWILDRYLFSRRKHIRIQQPISWLWVWISAFIAHFSHILLDWTNNYGVRPFFPFNAHWYSGDLVFIAEPILWALLLIALIFPSILALTDREVGDRRTKFRGRGWAIAALTGMLILWCFRWAEHGAARNLIENAQVTPTPAKRIALEPYPMNPWRWHAILETDTTWQTAEINTHTGAVVSDPRIDSLFKPAHTSATQAAKSTPLGRAYLDWSSWPVVRDFGPTPVPGQPAPDFPSTRQWSSIEFSDLRFAYAYLDLSMSGNSNQQLDQTLTRSGLSGWVYILDGPNGSREEAGQFLNGRAQK